MFIFRRLKITHDTHEFILDSGTVVNNPTSSFKFFKHNHICIYAVLRIRIRMDSHDFGLIDLHSESAVQMQIPDTDTDSAT
jgi:hypothetical protein